MAFYLLVPYAVIASVLGPRDTGGRDGHTVMVS
jgi:hypothetical protein